MNMIRSFVVGGAVLAAALTAAQAAPDVVGAWRFSVGTSTICQLVLTPDGSARPASDCATGNRVARWRLVADKLELTTASGETVGILYARDGTFTGRCFEDGRKLILSR